MGRPINIYGDGKQVRDLLFVDDLIGAFDKAYQAGEKTRGEIYNIGGSIGISLYGAAQMIIKTAKSGVIKKI